MPRTIQRTLDAVVSEVRLINTPDGWAGEITVAEQVTEGGALVEQRAERREPLRLADLLTPQDLGRLGAILARAVAAWRLGRYD